MINSQKIIDSMLFGTYKNNKINKNNLNITTIKTIKELEEYLKLKNIGKSENFLDSTIMIHNNGKIVATRGKQFYGSTFHVLKNSISKIPFLKLKYRKGKFSYVTVPKNFNYEMLYKIMANIYWKEKDEHTKNY